MVAVAPVRWASMHGQVLLEEAVPTMSQPLVLHWTGVASIPETAGLGLAAGASSSTFQSLFVTVDARP